MNPYLDTRYCNVKCTFQVIDLTAREDAAPSAPASALVSQIQQTVDEVRKTSMKMATLEFNHWALDGSMQMLNNLEDIQTGWWSEAISEEDGTIDTYIEFEFSEPHSSYGLSLFFDEKAEVFPTLFTITALNSEGNVIAETEVENSNVSCVIVAPMYNYQKIRITFARTNMPNRRIRITEVVFGIVEEFDKENTKELTITREIDFSSDSVPIGEIDLVFDNSDQRYNMVYPDGVYRFLKTGMPLQVEIGTGPAKDQIEYEKIGDFYYVSSESEDGALTAKITAQDILMYMERVDYPVPAGTTTTIEIIAVQIQSVVTRKIEFEIEEDLKDVKLMNLAADTEIKCRAVLQQACQALSAVCFVNKQGRVVIKKVYGGEPLDSLTLDKMADVPKITTRERINIMTVKNGDIVGSYQDKEDDEVIQAEKKNNAMLTASEANDVAKWLLENTRRLQYDIDGRGNPLHELTDTIIVSDAFGTQRNVQISKHVLKFDGALIEEIQGKTVIE